MKRVDGQLEYLKQKAQAEPTDPKTRVELGYTYYLKGQNDQAIQELNQAVLLDPKYFDAYYNLGLVMLTRLPAKKG
jgi:tetratricopeptide (TPR) repeat protein